MNREITKFAQELKELEFPDWSGILKIDVLSDVYEHVDPLSTLDVVVSFPDGNEIFGLISYDFLSSLAETLNKGSSNFYTIGKPLLFVREMRPNQILAGILGHLKKENLTYSCEDNPRPSLLREYFEKADK